MPSSNATASGEAPPTATKKKSRWDLAPAEADVASVRTKTSRFSDVRTDAGGETPGGASVAGSSKWSD